MYKSVLEEVFCEKEMPPAWWGSDDVWISFVSSTGRTIGPTPPTAQVTRWRQDGFDTGDLYEANHTIYVGEPQGRVFFAALALEVDNTNRARRLLTQFEGDITRYFLRRMSAATRVAIYGAIGLGLGVFLG